MGTDRTDANLDGTDDIDLAHTDKINSCVAQGCTKICHVQGVPKLVLQLCLLISRSHVNITKYPFNHVISKAREFF